MARICAIFCNPPLTFARLGGSTTPLDAYRWADPSNPRTDGDTVITPDWTLNVLVDGTVDDPIMPQVLQFRDGQLLRPVCPFIEIWARVGDPATPATWHDEPLTLTLLAAEGLAEKDLSFTLTARNRKAQRRTGNADLAFGTFPDLIIAGDDHQVHPVLASSPPGVANAMIPAGRHIPLGSIQVMKARPQPNGEKWSATVNVETVRLRLTPATGLVYGPPAAMAAGVENGPSVRAAQAFLNPAAGWFGSDGDGATAGGFVSPGDTFDTATDASNDTASLGVVDDTCEARLLVTLHRPALPLLAAHANIFSGPPDYAPDRRPIVSIADELNDRAGDWEARNAALSTDELDSWVSDLFQRIYETVSVLNVDHWRAANAQFELEPAKLGPPIAGDGLLLPKRPMGSRDKLRNQTLTVGTAGPLTPLPLCDHARERHLNLSAVASLRELVLNDPSRLRALVRGPFESEAASPSPDADPWEELRKTSMRMPPFMAQSTPNTPLTLTAWQYELLMKWADSQRGPVGVVAVAGAAPLSAEAIKRRADVLNQLDQAGPVR